jgi:hypothetical protein
MSVNQNCRTLSKMQVQPHQTYMIFDKTSCEFFGIKYIVIYCFGFGVSRGCPSEKLNDKIYSYYRIYFIIVDIFIEIGEPPSIQLRLINIDTRQYFFNIFQYFTIHQ